MTASTQRTLLGTLALTVVALGAACSSPSTQPSKAAVGPKAQAKVTALQLSGPATAFVGATSAPEQLVATATLDDGSASVVTARATWSSSRPDVLRSGSTAGQVQGVAPGEAVVTATVDGVSADYIVRVVRRFRLSGVIRAADTGGPLRGVTVGGYSGSDEAEWVTASDASGAYVVNTVTGPAEVSVGASVEGFFGEVRTLMPMQDTVMDFTLRPRQASDVTGAWRASLSASSTCRDLLPSTGRDREYDVTIRQESAQLLMTIGAPTMVRYPGLSQGGSSVEVLGAIEGTKVSSRNIQFGDVLNSTEELGVIGTFSGALIDGEIRGSFPGFLDHWTIPLSNAPVSRCITFIAPPLHSMVFRRK